MLIEAIGAVTWSAEKGRHHFVLAIVDRVTDRQASIDRTRRRADGLIDRAVRFKGSN